jgi:NAD(P)H-dependent FMN reductase
MRTAAALFVASVCSLIMPASSFARTPVGFLRTARGGVRGLSAATSGSDSLNVLVFQGSTRVDGPPRPARVGERVAAFVERSLEARGHLVSIVDPVDLDIPLLRKPHFAYAKGRAPEVLESLAGQIASADCFVMVTPEYNHAASPALMNTLNHFGASLFGFRPSAIVSYSMGQVHPLPPSPANTRAHALTPSVGAQWGGVRAAANLRPFLSELGCLPVSAMVHVPRAHEAFAEDGSPAVPAARGADAQDWEVCAPWPPPAPACLLPAAQHVRPRLDSLGAAPGAPTPAAPPPHAQAYGARTWSQLEWWAGAARGHRQAHPPPRF